MVNQMIKIVIGLVLIQSAVTQSVNRCVPFFLKEKVGFDLVGVDSSNKNSNFDVTIIGFKDEVSGKFVVGGKIVFRMCANVLPPQGCPADLEKSQPFAYFIEGTDCKVIGSMMSSQEKALLQSNGKIDGVSLSYSNKNIPEQFKAGTRFNLRYEVKCDPAKTENLSWSSVYDRDYIVLTTSSKAGCSYGMSDVMDIFESNRYICFGIFIFIGLVFTFFGNSAYKYTLLLAGFLLGFLIVAGIAYSLGMFINASDSLKYQILGGGILFGVIVGFLLFYFEKSTISLVCGVLATLMVIAILNLYFPKLELNRWVELGILVAAGIIGGVLGNIYKNEMLIVSTSFGGAFLVVMCIGFVTKTLESPAVIRAKAKAGEPIVG